MSASTEVDADQPEAGSNATTREYPLAGIKVIDLSHVYNGPYATFLMAMAGAEVIKVEPHQGELLRSRGDLGGAALPFAMLNSNKKSVTLNLRSAQGRELLKEMVARADVLVENFAPGVTDRLGIGPANLLEINPRLIYGSSSGYGKSGPYRDYPAMDVVMQAMCGIMNSTGFPDQPPVKSGAALCDFSGGIHLYAAIITALYERERTGKGRVVEVSMQDAVYAFLATNLGMLHARGADAPDRTGNRHAGLGSAPYNAYATRDGYVVINAPGDHHFLAILDVMGRLDLKDDPRYVRWRGARCQHQLRGRVGRGLDEDTYERRGCAPHAHGGRALCSRAEPLGGDARREHARSRQSAMDRSSAARPRRVAPFAARLRGDTASTHRAQPAARREQQGCIR